MSDDNKIEVCVTPKFITFEGNLECFVGHDAAGEYCLGKDKCAYVNKKAQGGDAFYEECAGKGLHSSVEKGAIFMWAIAVDYSLAWLNS